MSVNILQDFLECGKKVFFKNLYLHLSTLEDICSTEKGCLQFCQNSISMVKDFVVIFAFFVFSKYFCQKSVFFAFFVFSKNFLSKVCVDCCRLCEELALASSAAKGDNHQLEATSRNSITSITLLCSSRNSITLLMPLVEILSNDTNSIQYHTPQVLILC